MGLFKKFIKSMNLNGDEDIEEELTPIATTSWIKVYYRILFKPRKDWKQKQIDEHITKTYNDLIGIVTNIGQIVVDGKLVGFLNPFLNLNAIMTYEKLPKEFPMLKFQRNFTFMVDKSKEYKGCWEFWIKSKEKGKEIKTGLREIKKNEKVTYGYSPIDFAQDKFMLMELDKQLSSYLNVISTKGENMAYTDFNKEGEPIVRVKIGVLFMEHKVKDRIELMRIHPKIEKRCFGDDFNDFIEHFRKQKKDKNIAKWLNEVDKLLKNENL